MVIYINTHTHTHIYIYITYTFKAKKKQENFLGKFSPYQISCEESGDKMSLVKPEFSKLIMELIIFQCIFHEPLNQNSSLIPL